MSAASQIGRRGFMIGAAGSLASAPLAARAGAATSFGHGVASGDPSATSLVIWTAVAPQASAAVLDWRVRRPDGSLVREGRAQASAATGWTAKALVAGLSPDQSYLYEFTHRGVRSPIGRARTLPAAGRRPVRFAVFSCSRYASGRFHAYRHAAQDGSIDFALHLGDFIYEGGNLTSGQARQHEPPHELLTLTDYRTRHAQHKADADLQALHAAMPMLSIWDDHEFANDASRGGTQTTHPKLWAQRAAAARQAYFEWMPMLPNAHGGIWRGKAVGDLIDLFQLDTRIDGRADPLEPDDAMFRSPARQMLGAAQERWLAPALAAPGRRWTLVLSSVILSPIAWPETIRSLYGTTGPSWARELLDGRVRRTALGAGNPDAWDGYPAAQARMLEMLAHRKGRTLVLSGDTHSSWLFRLAGRDRTPIGWEVGVPSVTTEASLEGLSGSPEAIEAVFRAANPQLDYLHPSARGYTVVEVDADAIRVEWRHVSSVTADTPSWRVGKETRFVTAE